MFINSIFLPKNISDQTLPEGVSGKLGNFSHLFSNVFRIVKDEQEVTVPFQLANLSAEGTLDTQNELLKVSLLSNNKLNLENTNISMIVAAFLSKLSPGEFTEELADINKVKINEKVPKYFSLNKNEFIKEIKNIIDSLKNSDTKSLENVEISLVANGQSIKINPLTTNVVALENWVTEQLQSNTDFEIIVKRGQKKLAVDVEPVKNEVSKTEKPFEIVSIGDADVTETKLDPTINKNYVNPTSVSKNITFEESVSQQPLTALKQPYANNDKQGLKQVIPTIQNGANLTQKLNSESIDVSKKSVLKDLKNGMEIGTDLLTDITASINSKLNENLKNNISSNVEIIKLNNSISDSDLKSKPVLNNQEDLVTKSETITKKGNVLSDASLKLQTASSDKSVETKFNSLSNEVKVKYNPLYSDEILKNPETVKQALEVNVIENKQSDRKISVKSNQKTSSILGNKNSIQEKVVLADLVEKVKVKDIKINVQNGTKTGDTNSTRIQDEYQPKPISLKDNSVKFQNQSSTLNVDDKRILSSKTELKQTTVQNTFESESIKTKNSLSDIISEKPIVTKTELNIKSFENVKIQSTNKLSGQQELFVEKEFAENENIIRTKVEPIKTANNNQQSLKEITAVESGDTTRIEKNNFEQNKSITFDSPKTKLEANENPLTRKIAPTEIDNDKKLPEQKTNPLKVEVEKVKSNITYHIKVVNKENVKEFNLDSTQKEATQQNKTEIKAAESKSVSLMSEDNPKEEFTGESSKGVVKESNKEISALKSNSNFLNKSSEKTEVSSTHNQEKNLSNQKEKAIVENLRTTLKEFANDDIKQESVVKNQFDNKNVKVDFIQRRVYSQIPPLEVIADKAEIKSVKNSALNVETNKNESIQSIDEPLKSTQSPLAQNPKNEKQVWVKVSLEKNDNETVSEFRKSSHQQNKITIDAANDEMKKDFDQNNFSEKEPHEYQKSKPQTVTAESNQNTEQKSVTQTQPSDNHDSVTNIKVDIKTENNLFKSTLHTEEMKFTSRAAEMVEKVKVISSGEMIREISKVLENGEKQSIVLRLVPKELGSVKIILDTIDNVLTAKVEVENETVGHIVRNNVDQLKQNLLQNGVHVNSINISYHNSDQKQHGFNNHKRKNPGYLHENDMEEVDETVVSKKMGYNTYEYLA